MSAVKDNTSLSKYKEEKERRFEKQKNIWNNISTLSKNEQPSALFEKWPQKLPRWLKSKLDKDTYKGWRKIKNDDFIARLEVYESVENEILFNELLLDSYEKNQSTASDIVKLIFSLTGKKTVSISASVPDIGGVQKSLELDEGEQEVDNLNTLSILISLGLEFQGGIIIRQPSSLRTFAPNPKTGVSEWFNQERVYGIALGLNNWFPLSAKDVEVMCNTDADTGETLPPVPGMVYCSISDIKNISKSKYKH